MKQLFVLLLLANFTFANHVEEYIPPVSLEKSEKDPSLKPDESVFRFTFKSISDTEGKQVIFYSIDGSEKRAKLMDNIYFEISTTPGEHSFQFYYDEHHDEVTANSLVIKAQYRDEYSIRLENVDFPIMVEKPVIYLYPTAVTEVTVEVITEGQLTFTYPSYEESWKMTINPDGTIQNGENSYRYLFWESQHTAFIKSDPSTGSAIANKDIVSFLEASLGEFGFTTQEQADFITYWAPKMIRYPGCKIQFLLNDECNQFAQLNIDPKPDQVFRFYMLWSPLENVNDFNYLRPQKIQSISRLGFTVIEWGGSQIELSPKEVL
ncbi:MAG: hypothetical protein QNK23_05900 [Crocinitomicaceae bacterium]|nr:hypothetical protein [Crocinitomicaceae bacterium]